MKKLAVVFFLIVVCLTVWTKEFLAFLPESEIRYIGFIYLLSNKYEVVIDEIEKTDLDYIWWTEDGGNFQRLDANGEMMPAPYTATIIETAKSVGLDGIFLRRYDNGWYFFQSFDTREKGLFKSFSAYYGKPDSLKACEDIKLFQSERGECVTALFGDWYYYRFWIKKDV